jgi:hypothetical protein
MNDNNEKILHEMIQDFYPFAKKEMGFNKPVRIFLTRDIQNSQDPLGKTAYYDPQHMQVKLFYLNRHPKDVLRSLAHELMHHKQNCEGRLGTEVGEGPVDENAELSMLEEEANKAGFIVRKWEEQCKKKWKPISAYLDDEDFARAEGELMGEAKKKKKKAKVKNYKYNPWAVCTVSVGRQDSKKYERCVKAVKKQSEKKKVKKESVLSESKQNNENKENKEPETVKDHYIKRAERVFDKLTEKWNLTKKDK